MTWLLIIMLGCGDWGCQYVEQKAFTTKEACYAAMDRFVRNNGFDQKDIIMCEPKEKK